MRESRQEVTPRDFLLSFFQFVLVLLFVSDKITVEPNQDFLAFIIWLLSSIRILACVSLVLAAGVLIETILKRT